MASTLQNYDSSEDEGDPMKDLLKNFNQENKFSTKATSDTESDEESDVENKVDHMESEDDEDDDESENSISEQDSEFVNEVNNSRSNQEESEESKVDNFSDGKNDFLSSEELNKEEQIIIKENEEDEETAREDAGNVKDPFTIHLRNDLDNELYQSLVKVPVQTKDEKLNWPSLGNIFCQIPIVENKVKEPPSKKIKVSILEDKSYAEHGKIPKLINNINWNQLYVKSSIQNNIARANYENIKDSLDKNPSPLTSFQKELFSIMNNYQDLLYPGKTLDNESEIRFVYCLHVVNHILKTRTKILHHNSKIQKSKLKDISEIPDEYRDQGLVRPKVLILVPFRHSCLKIVELLISIFIGEDKGGSVINKTRFMEDFSGNQIKMPIRNPKPEDYEKLFQGNTDDAFKIGISITKKALKLYSNFYASDIIISSPLGLRLTIGAEGEEERDYDFLASVELLIMDQTEIFIMQNWDHILHIFDHLHLQPKSSHETDFSRVRSWCVNGWSKYYRQTLIFSSIRLPEIFNVFNKNCNNYAGKFKIINPVSMGAVTQVIVPIPQVFQKFSATDHIKAVDERFNFFTTQILPQYKDTIMSNTLIFVPSYFDFVKLRNYFRNEDLNFGQICEYSKTGKIARARDMFFHGDAHFLLYTERYHFYNRIRVKGIRHLIFYAPPSFPHFYSEMCNFLQDVYQNKKSGCSSNMTVTMIYCKYDMFPLSAIVGSERATQMVKSEKAVHMVMSDR